MGIVSLLPVFVAVGLSLWTKRALFSLLMGVLLGAILITGNPFSAVLYVVDPLFIDSVADRDGMKVIVFSLFIASTVEIMRVGQGTQALVDWVAQFATTRRRALVGTWFSGLIVFFDDYANCLIVGSSMRPITDRLKVSRAKLAYLVDSTAAPVATLALISTWVGYEVSLIDEAMQTLSPEVMKQAGLEGISAYGLFLEGLPYRFYPILALVFGFVLAVSVRDFGPMRESELQALSIDVEPSAPVESKRIWLGVIPIVLLIGVSMLDLYLQGTSAKPEATTISEIISAADGYDAMLRGSITAIISAVGLAKLLGTTGEEMKEAVHTGMGRIAEAIIILILAWSIGTVMKELGSADYLIQALDGVIDPMWFPSLVFVLAAGIAFATGTSFGTMGTLMPLALPLVVQSGSSMEIILAVTAAVLSGATWGDHCSPISDTTVLSSAGTGCDHAEHVRTQLPYAMVSGLISLACCSIPVGLGISWSVCLLLGTVACVASVWLLGRPLEDDPPQSTAA